MNPYELIKKANLTSEELGTKGKRVLELYQDAVDKKEKYSDDAGIQMNTAETFDKVEALITSLIKEAQEKKTKADKKPTAEDKKEAKHDYSKMSMKEIEEGMEKLKACDLELKQLKKAQRVKQAKKRKKSPKKTRYVKLQEKIDAIRKLMPPALAKEEDTIQNTETILETTFRKLVKEWGMNELKAKPKVN